MEVTDTICAENVILVVKKLAQPADWLRLESTKTYITFLTKEATNTSNYGLKPQLEFTRQLACHHSWAS